jgi:hypothetical protein
VTCSALPVPTGAARARLLGPVGTTGTTGAVCTSAPVVPFKGRGQFGERGVLFDVVAVTVGLPSGCVGVRGGWREVTENP